MTLPTPVPSGWSRSRRIYFSSPSSPLLFDNDYPRPLPKQRLADYYSNNNSNSNNNNNNSNNNNNHALFKDAFRRSSVLIDGQLYFTCDYTCLETGNVVSSIALPEQYYGHHRVHEGRVYYKREKSADHAAAQAAWNQRRTAVDCSVALLNDGETVTTTTTSDHGCTYFDDISDRGGTRTDIQPPNRSSGENAVLAKDKKAATVVHSKNKGTPSAVLANKHDGILPLPPPVGAIMAKALSTDEAVSRNNNVKHTDRSDIIPNDHGPENMSELTNCHNNGLRLPRPMQYDVPDQSHLSPAAEHTAMEWLWTTYVGVSREGFNNAFDFCGTTQDGIKLWTCTFKCPWTREVHVCGQWDSVGTSKEIGGVFYYQDFQLARRAMVATMVHTRLDTIANREQDGGAIIPKGRAFHYRRETSEYYAAVQAAALNHPLMEVHKTTTTQSATIHTKSDAMNSSMLCYQDVQQAHQTMTEAMFPNSPTNVDPNVELEPDATSRQTMDVIFKKANPLQTRLCGEQGPAIMERAKRFDRDLSSRQMSLAERRDFLDSVQMLKSALIQVISTRFPGTRLDICGSCLSGLFSRDSDVDLSIHIPQLQRWHPKAGINALYGIFTSKAFRNKFRSLEAVQYARIPVLKGVYYIRKKNRSLSFDICAANDMSVANSKLLREYAVIDDKTRAVMSAVHVWAKENNIASAALGYLSSYAWKNLAVFYLQHVGLLPNLQCPDLMKALAMHPDSNDPSHCIDGLDTRFITWDVLKSVGGWNMNEDWKEAPVCVLLHGFFHFYAYEFPRDEFAVSIRVGKVAYPKSMFKKAWPSFLCIEDPFRTFGTPEAHDLCKPVNALKNRERILRALVDGEAQFCRLLLGEDDC